MYRTVFDEQTGRYSIGGPVYFVYIFSYCVHTSWTHCNGHHVIEAVTYDDHRYFFTFTGIRIQSWKSNIYLNTKKKKIKK